LLAFLGLAVEGELAVDDGAAEGSLGVVVGRLHPRGGSERPERGPDLQEVAGHAVAVLVARRFAGEASECGLELSAQHPDLAFELLAVLGVREDLPCPEQALADVQAELSELFLDGEAFGVRGEIPAQVCPADLPARQRQMAIGPPAV
jgi:hypothetical protein